MNQTQYELYHYGVKGMKWGHRKKIESGVKKAAGMARRGANELSDTLKNPNQRTLFGENAVGQNRRAAKQHNIAIRNQKETAKQNLQAAKKTKDKKQIKQAKQEYKSAKSARTKNLAGRAATQILGFTDSGRGSYYRNREMGKSVAESALNAYGRQTVTNLQFASGPFAAGTLAGEQYLRRKGYMR